MIFTKLQIPDIILIEPKVFGDERGFFMETYKQTLFAANGISQTFVQDNHSSSRQGILRGLHYQIRHPQGKLIRVISGTVFDVAVDIRSGSPTFGQWVGVNLSAKNKHQIWIPPGFAHGFFVLSETAEVIYKVTDWWYEEFERSILWNDPLLNISWPLDPGQDPVLSAKDRNGLKFEEAMREIEQNIKDF